MDLQLDGLRVLITAGASGIGLATARAFAREGARVHVCDVDRGALDALARSDSALTQSVCDVVRPQRRRRAVRRCDSAARRFGRPRQQRGHRGSDGQMRGRGRRKRGSARSPSTSPASSIARSARFRTCASSSNPSIVNLSSAAGRFGFRAALAVRGVEVGGDRLHEVAVDRARRRRHSRQRDLPGLRRRVRESNRCTRTRPPHAASTTPSCWRRRSRRRRCTVSSPPTTSRTRSSSCARRRARISPGRRSRWTPTCRRWFDPRVATAIIGGRSEPSTAARPSCADARRDVDRRHRFARRVRFRGRISTGDAHESKNCRQRSGMKRLRSA